MGRFANITALIAAEWPVANRGKYPVSEQIIERGCNGFAATVLALLAVPVIAMATSLASHAQTIKLTADMPVRTHALLQADYDAIVAEAQDIARLTRDTNDVSQWPAQWRSGLNPAKLAALWGMPASATLDAHARVVLVEQAARWDMLAFDRPSDAAALWEKLWPRGLGGRADAGPNSSGITLAPDVNWSDDSVAMVSMFSCFPTTAWTAPGDPAVWATMHLVVWQWRNSSADWDGLRQCIKATIDENAWGHAQVTSSAVDNQADARRTDAVVGILKAKFTRELSNDVCKRQGPDSCLVVYTGLFALDRKNPQLVPILHRMERSFDLDRPIALPALESDADHRRPSVAGTQASDAPPALGPPAKKVHRNRFSDVTDADRIRLDATLAEVERRKIFITLKLPVLLDHPEAWRRGELDRTLRQAMDLTVLVERMQAVEHRSLQSQRQYDDPWQWVDPSADPAINASLRDMGAAYARSVGCDNEGLDLGTRMRSFWQGYAIELVRSGRGSGCQAVNALRLPEVYQAAVQGDDATAAREMAVFAPIDVALSSDGDARTQALDAMTTTCAARKDPSARDPWKLCAGVAARDVQIAEAERKRVADEQARLAAIKAAQPPPDPYACGDGVVMLAVKALGYNGDADFWSREQTACRVRPENPKEAIVALTYAHGDQLSGKASDNSDNSNGYDADVLIVRTEDGTVAARNAPAAHIDSDAITFTGVGIDTADYALAPGRRAFGIRAGHVSHCYACDYGQTDLRLYLLRGNKLDDILDTMMDETRGEGDGSDCNDIPTVSTRTIKVAATKAHGLADLLLTTTSAMDPDVGSVAVAACKDKSKIPTASVDTIKLSFNGRAYPVPADGN
jgi:hypothetical protein